jgi:hypothetical protein
MFRSIARRLLRTQPEPVQQAARTLLNEIRLARAVRHSSRQFAALDGEKDLKLHLGCGPELKSGWINVDLNLNGTVPQIGPGLAPTTKFILYDLRSGTLPLADESCRRTRTLCFRGGTNQDERGQRRAEEAGVHSDSPNRKGARRRPA